MTTPCTARRHSTNSAYRYGCRCPEARELYRLYKKRRREGRALPGRVPQIGTSRRLQALSAIGWTLPDLSQRLGLREQYVRDLRLSRRADTVLRTTAEKVARLYKELSGTPGPSKKARLWAARYGWAPPLLWEYVDIDDPNAQPAADERPAGHKRIDLREVEFFTSLGMSREDAARRMGVQLASIEQAERRAARRTNLAQAPTMRRALEQAFADDEAGAA